MSEMESALQEIEPVNRLNSNATPGVQAMQNKKFNIAGDVIARTVAGLADDNREAIKWAAGYCRNHNLSCEEFGAKLRKQNGEPYSDDSIYQMFTGRREEKHLGPIVAEIERFRKLNEERQGLVETGFIETKLTKRIWETCRRAFLRKKLTFIFGESQIGKTTALEEYARRNNHGETYYVRMPTRGALGDLLEELAIRLGIPAQQRLRELRRRIIECFDDRTLLIVDECHQCFSSHYSNRSLASLEFCREIQDRRKCGLVLCGTNIFRDGITRGPHARMLRQLWLRGYSPLQLPDVPSTADLAQFARAFGLDPAADKVHTVNYHDEDGAELKAVDNPVKLQTQLVRDRGLGRWLSILQQASDDARLAGGRMTWGRVIVAHEIFKRFESV